MDEVFKALGSPIRRAILDIVKNEPGARVSDICLHFEMSRIAVTKHLNLLEEAQLLHSRKEGRERRLYHNPVPIQMIYDRWTDEYSGFWASKMTAIKYKVERESKRKSSSEED